MFLFLDALLVLFVLQSFEFDLFSLFVEVHVGIPVELLLLIHDRLTKLVKHALLATVYVGLLFFVGDCHATCRSDSDVLRYKLVTAHVVDEVLVVVVELLGNVVEGLRVVDTCIAIIGLSLVILIDNLLQVRDDNLVDELELI